jgi:hypothetical protein
MKPFEEGTIGQVVSVTATLSQNGATAVKDTKIPSQWLRSV